MQRDPNICGLHCEQQSRKGVRDDVDDTHHIHAESAGSEKKNHPNVALNNNTSQSEKLDVFTHGCQLMQDIKVCTGLKVMTLNAKIYMTPLKITKVTL